jgi:hypothetical protein
MLRRCCFTICAFALCSAAAETPPDVVLVPQQISPHGWFFQGEAGMASAQNKGFMSNAGFVVTSDGVVVFDTLGTHQSTRWWPRSPR